MKKITIICSILILMLGCTKHEMGYNVDKKNKDEYHFFSRDKKHLFWQGWLVEGCNVDSFVFKDSKSGHDDKFEYHFSEARDGKDAFMRGMVVKKTPIGIEKP